MSDTFHSELSEPSGVPPGRWVELAGRGETFIREVDRAGDDHPPIVLLHGWVGTAATNWLPVYDVLASTHRVIGIDHRGHGRGLRSTARFRLADCADDVATLLDALNVDHAILVGFSMGGPIAQLTWRRHRARVAGIVFASTSYRFVQSDVARLFVTSAVPALAHATRVADVAGRLPMQALRAFVPSLTPSGTAAAAAWAAGEVRRHSVRSVIEAGVAIGAYDASEWIHEIDVPTAVVVTARDRAVDPAMQMRLANAIAESTLYVIADGHVSISRTSFTDVIAQACHDVSNRLAAAA